MDLVSRGGDAAVDVTILDLSLDVAEAGIGDSNACGIICSGVWGIFGVCEGGDSGVLGGSGGVCMGVCGVVEVGVSVGVEDR